MTARLPRWAGALALIGVLVLCVLPAGPAFATGPGDVASALREDPLYVADDAEASIDEDRVRSALEQARRSSGVPVYVALLPARAADALGGDAALNRSIGQAIGQGAALVTVAGQQATGGSDGVGLGSGQADAIVQQALRGNDLTDGLVAAVSGLGAAASAGPGTDGSGSDGSGSSASGGGGAVLAVLGLLAVAGVGLYAVSSSRRRRARMAGYRADITSLYDRLGADVSTLAAGDDQVARQALADAAERYNATGALLATSDTQGEYAAARRTVAEGLAATRLARTRLGLDPGPEVPPPPAEQPQMLRQETVEIEGRSYSGTPRYTPGRPHYWQGGQIGRTRVPGGWYGVDFGSLVLGGVLGGMLGGGSSGYDDGYRDASRDSAGWGGGGGGWSGGGDWGGGGGGGDWGGGGGGGGGGGSW